MQKTPYSSRKASEKTLLEDYAGQALVGISSKIMNVSKDFSKDLEMQKFVASVSFGIAEAMIKEAEKGAYGKANDYFPKQEDK